LLLRMQILSYIHLLPSSHFVLPLSSSFFSPPLPVSHSSLPLVLPFSLPPPLPLFLPVWGLLSSTAGQPSTWLSKYGAKSNIFPIPSLSFLPQPAVVISSFLCPSIFSFPHSFFTIIIQQRHGRTFDVSDYVLSTDIKVPYLKLLMLQAVSPLVALSNCTQHCPCCLSPDTLFNATMHILRNYTVFCLFSPYCAVLPYPTRRYAATCASIVGSAIWN
jgi:hypothetical protein